VSPGVTASSITSCMGHSRRGASSWSASRSSSNDSMVGSMGSPDGVPPFLEKLVVKILSERMVILVAMACLDHALVHA
jgi:hypothetical protein